MQNKRHTVQLLPTHDVQSVPECGPQAAFSLVCMLSMKPHGMEYLCDQRGVSCVYPHPHPSLLAGGVRSRRVLNVVQTL